MKLVDSQFVPMRINQYTKVISCQPRNKSKIMDSLLLNILTLSKIIHVHRRWNFSIIKCYGFCKHDEQSYIYR